MPFAVCGGDIYDIDVAEPWFSAIAAGEKCVVIRANKDAMNAVHSKSKVRIHNKKGSHLRVKVERVVNYPTLQDAIVQEGLLRSAPGAKTVGEAMQIYRQSIGEAEEQEFGVTSIHLKKGKTLIQY